MMKKLFCAVLLVALTLAVAACGTGEEIISDAEAVKIENYADISISVLNLALVIIATWIAIVQHRRNSYDRREENLKKTAGSLSSDRFFYEEEARTYHSRALNRDLKEPLYISEGWIQDPEDDVFPLLSEVSLSYMDKDPGTEIPKPGFLPERKAGYANNLKYYCGFRLMNLPLYGLGGVTIGEDNKKVSLQIRKGYYFDFYDTCEVLNGEIVYSHRIKRCPHPSQSDLKLRKEVKDPFVLTNRFVGIGVSTLTILKNVETEDGERRSYFLMHKRSGSVAESPGSYHVVPAGSYQPVTDIFPDSPEPMTDTAVREFGEELLKIEEFDELSSYGLLRNSQLSQTLPGSLFFLGLGLDPLNTKAEILTALLIDVQAQTSPFGGKKTLKDLTEYLQDNYEGQVFIKELSEDMVKQFRDSHRSTPAFRQIMSIVLDHPDSFGIRS